MSATGELRVWYIINPPAEPTYVPVATPEHAIRTINTLAELQLTQDTIWGNAFGLQVWDGEEWVEWYSEEGDNIDDFEQTLLTKDSA